MADLFLGAGLEQLAKAADRSKGYTEIGGVADKFSHAVINHQQSQSGASKEYGGELVADNSHQEIQPLDAAEYSDVFKRVAC